MRRPASPTALAAAVTAWAFAGLASAGFRNAFDITVSSSYSVLEVQEASDGGFAVAGGRPIFLLKTDPTGATDFLHRWDADAAASLDILPDGSFILAGERRNYDEFLLMRTDAAGDVQSSHLLLQGSSIQGLYSVRGTPDGGAIASGIFTIKTDAAGTVEWSRIHVGGGGNVNCVRNCRGGGYVATGEGQYGNPANDYNIVVTRLADDGTATWNRTFGGDGYDWSAAVEETGDGGFIASGWTTSFGAGGSDGFLLKLDDAGALLWALTLGTPGDDALQSVVPLGNSGFIAAGRMDGQAALVRTDVNGALLWAQAYPASAASRGSTFYSVKPTRTGGFIAAGRDEAGRLLMVATDALGDTGGCPQVTPAVEVVAAPFLTGTNSTSSPGSFSATPVALTPSTQAPTVTPCIPATNRPPNCDAGADIVAPCDGVALTGASASDPDGDAVTFAWTSSCAGTRFSPSADVIDPVVTLDLGCSVTCDLTLTVDDGNGGACADTRSVTIDCASDPAADCDGEGVPNVSDCAPLDPTAFATPSDPALLMVAKELVTDAALLTWTDSAPAAGTGTVHDVVGGRIADLWIDRGFTMASCVADDAGVTHRDDRAQLPPLPGYPHPGTYYLVRAQNACGASTFGDGSFGPRTIDPAICP